MVGVASTNDASGIEVVEPFDALERVAASQLDVAERQLADMLRADWEIIEFPVLGAVASLAQSQHIRFRCRSIVIGCDTAGIATVTLGTRTFRFFIGVGTASFEMPLVIERGVDMSIAVSAGIGNAYLIGKGE